MKSDNKLAYRKTYRVSEEFAPSEHVVVYSGDCLGLLGKVPDESLQLIVTSQPYNIGKEYEKRLDLDSYLREQRQVITECVRALSRNGSICWQVGNYVDNGANVCLERLT